MHCLQFIERLLVARPPLVACIDRGDRIRQRLLLPLNFNTVASIATPLLDHGKEFL